MSSNSCCHQLLQRTRLTRKEVKFLPLSPVLATLFSRMHQSHPGSSVLPTLHIVLTNVLTLLPVFLALSTLTVK